tara:strand:- start:671 stop:1825 length:1155 start_codon:yes stop_codon:yes gene_type:complete
MTSSKITSLGCGIDTHKDKSTLFFATCNAQGAMKCIASKTVKMTKAELNKAIAWVVAKRHKVDPCQQLPFQIVLESTSRYHERFLYALHEAELPVCIVQGRLLKSYIRSLGINSKTDKLDAKGMAHFACCRNTPLWQPFSKHILELRDLLRARKNLIKRVNQFKNQIHALAYAKHTAKEIVRSYKRLVKQILKELDRLEQAIKVLYEQDETLRKKVAPIVKDVKGLGLLTVLTVAAETNGFTTVSGRRQLAKYAGYDIIENQSGNSSGKTRISKRGNANIRTAMYMAAVSHIRHGEGNIINAYNRAQAKKTGIYKHANVVVQRKLLLLIQTLWTTGAKYDPYHMPEQNEPKAFSPSTAKNAPELSSEAHGIAPSEEALPILAQN